MNTQRQVLVSVCCMTYNHEHFIEQCLNGFISQKTNFDFEILVHEDASTDETANLVREYEIKYPHLFRCVYQTENQFTKQNTLINILFPMSRGRYIAICEGDDYWTDPFKLQKQVDFLENNSEYVLTSHNAIIVDHEGNRVSDSKLSEENQRAFSRDELVQGVFILTLSMCFRNVFNEFPPEIFKVVNGDTFLISMLGLYGHAHFHHDISPAVYRVHSGGIWSAKDATFKEFSHRNTFFYIYKYQKRNGISRKILDMIFIKYIKCSKRLMLLKRESRWSVLKIYTNTLYMCIIYSHFNEVIPLSKEAIKILFNYYCDLIRVISSRSQN